MKLALIPQPHRITTGKRYFSIPATGTIGVSHEDLYPVARKAKTIFKRHSIDAVAAQVGNTMTISLGERLRPGAYRLKIQKEGVLLEAESVPAAFHGLQTLLQIASQSGAARLPMLSIDDWPDFQDRGLYYDISRGRVPKLKRLLEQADLLAKYKINHLQLYIEHTFRFRGHPDIGKNASPLAPEDILQLDSHCRDRHIELVPSLASLGHLASVLKHPQYHHLAEDWGIGCYIKPEMKMPAPRAWTLSPANADIYDFLDSLFGEFLPLFSSDRFNVCCDETYDLGWGQSYQLCRRKGKGRVYLDHIIMLNRLCRKYGKRIMFWGDIIRKYPELISKIPSDVTVLDWGYACNWKFAAIRDFKEAGLDFLACPGTSSWVSLFPRLHEARRNIHGFAVAGKKNGAQGLLNTDWGDRGHPNFMEFSWHGYLFGAEQAWNVNADMSSFTTRFVRLFLCTGRDEVTRALETLGDITHLSVDRYYQSIWWHIFFAPAQSDLFAPVRRPAWVCRSGEIKRTNVILNAAVGNDNLKRIRKVRAVFSRLSKTPGADPNGVLPYWIFAVDTIRHAARKLTVLGDGGKDTPAARRSLKKEMTNLMKQFENLWRARNRPSEIRITRARYRAALRSLSTVP